jgi:8-oxo-dGTP diphosphatase
VDVALLTARDGALHTLLHRRDHEPFTESFAIPGGFVGIEESLEAAARRVLAHKVGIDGVYIEQLYTFGSPGRDPRGRVISVAYYALLDAARASGGPGVAARVDVPWDGETGGPVSVVVEGEGEVLLPFDHADILGMAVKRIRGKLNYTPIGFQLLPESFTLRQLQSVHETVLGRGLNKDSFRRRMIQSGQLEATGERQQDVGHRPAELYRFLRRSAI